MEPVLPSAWILAAGPQAPGTAGVWGGSRDRVLLTGAGLAWLDDPGALASLVAGSSDLALCSRSARDSGWDADRSPPGVRWSSVATWLSELDGRPFAVLLP